MVKVTETSLLAVKKPRGGSWKPGQSGNPAGRPPEGQSWSAVIKSVTNATAEELAAMVGAHSALGRELAKMPRGVPMKTLIAIRLCTALLFTPSAGLARAVFDVEELQELEARVKALEDRAHEKLGEPNQEA